jgi:hypothetical protein
MFSERDRRQAPEARGGLAANSTRGAHGPRASSEAPRQRSGAPHRCAPPFVPSLKSPSARRSKVLLPHLDLELTPLPLPSDILLLLFFPLQAPPTLPLTLLLASLQPASPSYIPIPTTALSLPDQPPQQAVTGSLDPSCPAPPITHHCNNNNNFLLPPLPHRPTTSPPPS